MVGSYAPWKGPTFSKLEKLDGVWRTKTINRMILIGRLPAQWVAESSSKSVLTKSDL